MTVPLKDGIYELLSKINIHYNQDFLIIISFVIRQVWSIENAHSPSVRELDFNPNRQYYLATCGDDCQAKFWDIRSPATPVLILSDHSHWIWSIRYNHFHDQLVLTSSSDSRVILSRVASISSEPFGHLVEDEENAPENEQEK